MDSATITDQGDAVGFGQAVTHSGRESTVRVWGACDGRRAWFVRQGLHNLIVAGRRRITLDVAGLRFADFTAVAILAGALVQIRQIGVEVALSPTSSGAYRVLRRADLATSRAAGAR